MKSYYINTDLEVMSTYDLSSLVPILEEKCDLLYSDLSEDLWHICVEESGSGIRGRNDSPENDISGLLDVIEGLGDTSKELLRSAKTFDFNIGWQANETRPYGKFSVSNDLLQRISSTGATLTVTIYPSDENDYDG